jgi:hypothetical protein
LNTIDDIILNLGFDLELLPSYFIHVYNENKEFISLFDSLEMTYKSLNPNRFNDLTKFKLYNVRISNYVNKENYIKLIQIRYI